MIIQKDFSLKELNTFGLDVKSKAFVNVSSLEELKSALFSDAFKGFSKLVLGGGSNILFTKDFEGLVIKISIKGIRKVKECEDKVVIEAGAGELWHDLVVYSLGQNLGGIENLSLIPGTVGAAPMQNIGAYGVELKDVFHSLKALNVETGELKTFTKEECRFGYRTSIFKKELKNKYIVIYVSLALSKFPLLNFSYGSIKSEIEKLKLENVTIKDVSDIVCKIRNSKLPDPKELGNAGSFFKNPVIVEDEFNRLKKLYPDIPAYTAEDGKVKLAAGWLIEKSGWRGKSIGNAASHHSQSLVLVNLGNAKPGEITELADMIKESVYKNFGILLEEEVNII